MKREFAEVQSFLTPIFTEHAWMMLKCPICADDTVHIQRVYALEADPGWADPEGVSEYGELYGIPVAGIDPGSCRGSLVIEVHCAYGHRWIITFEGSWQCTTLQAKEIVS